MGNVTNPQPFRPVPKHVTDPFQLTALAKIGRVDHVHLDSHRMSLHLSPAEYGDMYFVMGHCNSALRMHASIAETHALLGVALSGGESMRFNDIEVREDDLLLFGSGAEIEAAGGKGFRWLTLAAPWSRVISFMQCCEGRNTSHLKSRCVGKASHGMAALTSSWWCRLTSGQIESPGQDWFERYMAAYADAEGAPEKVSATFSRRRCVVLTAEEYMRENLGASITTETLCRVTGVSRRSLEYYFLDVIGLSPKAYLRQLRLHAAYRMLPQVSRGWGDVRLVAKQCGLTHLGEFARDYRQLFGELPKETVRRAGAA